ncbi:MAG: chemotaxis protein CheA [Betaproteobacteria bacterium]|nr:chemotaxis protein CheA [Betaproteobacteria bacterium]
MSDFAGMEELLQDFLTEANELLSDVDNKLVELEKHPDDAGLLNDVFRGFHTIKGGAGFLNVEELVKLCHLTENLFDRLRNRQLSLSADLMDVILSATMSVREMFSYLDRGALPPRADQALLDTLQNALDGKLPTSSGASPSAAGSQTHDAAVPTSGASGTGSEPDWQRLYDALLGREVAPTVGTAPTEPPIVRDVQARSPGRRSSDQPDTAEGVRAGRRESDKVVVAHETTIRIDTNRLDQVLNLSGEIGLAKNRLNCLRTDIIAGKTDGETLRALDEAVSHLDLLVGDLQNAVMKTRMQPIGRLFQKYPRVARDMARQLGKNVELILEGEDTELDKTMIEELGDPLIHLVRNAVDHGLESPDERRAAGKTEVSRVRLSAQQVGDHIVLEISDDGRGMKPDALRQKAVDKGLIDADTAANMDDKHALHLVFLPGFSTKEQVSNFSGRGVGMDVVKTNIQKLNGRIDIKSVVGQGTTFSISLPLTLAILPVLVVRAGDQSFAVPLSLVREIINIDPEEVQEVSGRATLLVREEVLEIRSLARLIGWEQQRRPAYGVLMQTAVSSFILAVDGFVGRDDVVIKPLDDIKPKGIAGATLSGDGSVVLVLDMEQLLSEPVHESRRELFELAA